jgi:hypothetical protein
MKYPHYLSLTNRTKAKYFIFGAFIALTIFLTIGAMDREGTENNRFQISGTDKHLFVVDTRTGEVKWVFDGENANGSQMKQLGKPFEEIAKSLYYAR